MIYDQAVIREHNLANGSAWAAAAEYIWRKHQVNPVSQKEISGKYGISSTTLAKYVKSVKELLK